VSVTNGSNTYYYIRNSLGNITGLADVNGNRVVAYTYDPWGKILSTTDTSGTNIGTLNPFRYKGYYYDTESGLYYLQSRYYDPNICRFLSSDDLSFLGASGTINGLNLYSYCEYDPVNNVDPTGYLSASQLANQISISAILGMFFATLSLSYSKGIGAISLYVTKIITPVAIKAFWWKPLLAATVIAAAVIIVVSAVLIYFSKASRESAKSRATNAPSWLAGAMGAMPPHLNESAQRYAARLLNQKYGAGRWRKGANTEYNKIVKYLQRNLKMK